LGDFLPKERKKLKELNTMLRLNIPRLNLINLLTPLNELKKLSKTLGGPRIFVKRDDLTALG
jgi:1-aminocyclopropane-1-carboxylate deaminase/D-cysteine desulfhydrase-like pyridoxal-dependent ACC family enzyme